MSQEATEGLGKRLDRLERENRRLTRIGAVLLVGLLAVGLMGQALPNRRIVEAEMFIVRDKTGNIRVMLGPEKQPFPRQPGESLRNPSGIILDDTDTNRLIYGLHVYGVDGAHRASLNDGQTTGVQLSLYDAKTYSEASLHAKGGSVALVLSSTDAKRGGGGPQEPSVVQGMFGAFEGGSSWLTLARSREVRSLNGMELTLPKDKAPYLTLKDENGVNRVELDLLLGQPGLTLKDEKGTIRAVLGHTALETTRTGSVEQRPASSLVLFDKDGKVIWKAP